MKHIIAVLLENEPGALSRVVGLFSARGYNIESLTVAPTEDPSLSRMTLQTNGSDDVIEQMKRMADIFRGRVIDVTDKSYTIELTGDQAKNDAFLQAIETDAILETVRTGASGIGRGERVLRV